jgi:uncharacterized protein (TIGR02246 family)
MHKRVRGLLAALLLLAATMGLTLIQARAAATKEEDEAAIRAVIEAQVAAWNRGDIPDFMTAYENSPDTTFVGTDVNKGFVPILERYKKAYANHDQMGTLTFSKLDIRMLPSTKGATEYAVVTGRFHLERNAKGEGTKDDGIFSLVWRKSAGKWKILLDHTS